MNRLTPYRNCIVTALCGLAVTIVFATASIAQDQTGQEQSLQERMDGWFAELADPDNPDWQRPYRSIELEWSKSGSPAFDLLLKRGQDAITAGDLPGAIEHLTALTDQAPDFAEGWNARATAYYLAGYYGPSILDIQRVLALNPRHFGALAGLGLILQETGPKEQAKRAFEASLAIHPHQEGISQALEALERETSGTDL
jgi:tetratricopeptide (TPR) repeat protein